MRRTFFLATIVLCSAVLAEAGAIAQGLSPQFMPAEQLLVLKNGEVMRGRVTRNAEHLILQTEQGSRLVLAADRTEFVCNSMDEAYWGKLARIKATDIVGQKNLFHWCLQNQLLDRAQNQIDILLQMKASASDLEYLDRQLNVALIQQQNNEQRLAEAEAPIPKPKPQTSAPNESRLATNPTAPETQLVFSPIKFDATIGHDKTRLDRIDETIFRPLPSLNSAGDQEPDLMIAQLPPMDSQIPLADTQLPLMVASLLPANAQLPLADAQELEGSSEPSVRQVGFEEEIPFDTISLDHKIPSASSMVEFSEAKELVDDRIMTSIQELDRETRSMPEGTVGHYRQRVERVLANGCSAAKCHDADSRIMPLMQIGRSQSIPRRQSQRNLHNVLKYVDRAKPFESRLFIAATTPHGGSDQSILKPGSPHRDNLMKWLIMLSDDPQEALFSALETEREASEPVSVAVDLVEPEQPEPDAMMPTQSTSLDFPATIGEIPKLDAVDSGFIPVDPFDPEIFNRKFRK